MDAGKLIEFIKTTVMDFWNHWTKRPRTYFATALGLVIALWSLTFFFSGLGEQITGQATASLDKEIDSNLKIASLLPQNASGTGKAARKPDPDLDRLLTKKFHDVNLRAAHHLKMAALLAKYGYAQNCMAILASSSAAVFLFFVGRRGVTNVDPNILVGSAVLAAAAAGYVSLGSVFQISENLKANASAYVQLLTISDQIATFGRTAPDRDPKVIDQFVAEVDKEVSAARAIDFTFDASKAASTSDILGTINQQRASKGQ